MEAFLLTLDVACIVLLCVGVVRASRSGDPERLGVFMYADRLSKRKQQPGGTGMSANA